MELAKDLNKLQIDKISISFGGLKAVSEFSLELGPSELYGLIGPNGAGKTTVFNLITGVYQPDHGTMALNGKEFQGLPPFKITKRGIARTFQNIRLFETLTVLQNVMISFHMNSPYGYLDLFLRTPKFYQKEREMVEEALNLLKLMKIDSRAQDRADSLSYGDKRRLEIARALAAHPKVLLLDEPAAGLNSSEKVDLMTTVKSIRDEFKVAILVIEHDMKLVMSICECIIVLDHGEVIAKGTPKEIQNNPKVIEAYLGVA